MINRIDVWDGWRGLAICCVLIGHFFNIPNLAEHRLGVDIFFVLSGMLMSGILFEQRMPLKKFYVRRFSRIYPALLVFVAISAIGAYVIGMGYQGREIFANLTFIRTYYPADPHIWAGPFQGHLWSLNVEEHAYMIMSLITLVVAPKRWAALVLLVLGLGGIAISMVYYFFPWRFSLPNEYLQLRTEAAISFIFLSASYNLYKKQHHIRVKGWQPVIALALVFTLYIDMVPAWTTTSVTPLLLAFAVNHLQDAAQWFQRTLRAKPLRMMGIWSYSIYLWQQPFYKAADAQFLPGGNVSGLALGIGLGIASFYLIEQPLRARINNYWNQRSASKQVQQSVGKSNELEPTKDLVSPRQMAGE